ncbi:MAG TPA: response regulator [Anaerolineales bacterium]|jgi:CheY-like chemotaxis protein|nr:response regulator [Anaerolineales bacterium]
MITALVVDDNRQFADSLCEILRYLDIEAEAAYGALTALQRVKVLAPSAVFLDINMPGLDGLEVFSYFKREPYLANTAVFIISSETDPDIVKQALDLGARAYLTKPVSMEEIEKVLREAELFYE